MLVLGSRSHIKGSTKVLQFWQSGGLLRDLSGSFQRHFGRSWACRGWSAITHKSLIAPHAQANEVRENRFTWSAGASSCASFATSWSSSSSTSVRLTTNTCHSTRPLLVIDAKSSSTYTRRRNRPSRRLVQSLSATIRTCLRHLCVFASRSRDSFRGVCGSKCCELETLTPLTLSTSDHNTLLPPLTQTRTCAITVLCKNTEVSCKVLDFHRNFDLAFLYGLLL
jgi:hypothetical protein